jgi:LacI family transcriptional regulator
MLNVSHTTVSRSLNNSPSISKETKARVLEIAKKHNYRPNVSARSLVLSKSYNIGLFFTTLETGTTAHFVLDAVRGVNSIIRGTYKLAVEAIADQDDFHQVSKRNFDGILVISQSPNDDAFIAHVQKEGIPQVVMNREVEGHTVTTVLSNDYQGVYQITRHIIDNGHRRIGIIEGKEGFRSAKRRKEGFIAAHEDAGLVFDQSLAIAGKYNLQSGYEAMVHLLHRSPKPTAVFCSNDEMAVGAMKAAKDHGLEMPDDMSIAGFDDMGFTAYLSPALTTVLRPIEEMSTESTQILLNKIEYGAHKELGTIHFDTRLVIRESILNLGAASQ